MTTSPPAEPGHLTSSMESVQTPGGYSLRKQPSEASTMGLRPLPRDSRGSLEVFKPAGFSTSSRVTGEANSFRVRQPDTGLVGYSEEEEQEDRSINAESLRRPQFGKVKQQVDQWLAVPENIVDGPTSGTDGQNALGLMKKPTPDAWKQLNQDIAKSSLLESSMVVDPGKEVDIDVPVANQFPSFEKSKCENLTASRGHTKTDYKSQQVEAGSGKILSEAGLVDRAAEWGLVVKTSVGSGKVEGVKTRTSGEERSSGNSQRTSGTYVRTSEESDTGSDTARVPNIPRVSKNLKDALETFQQTFVVSDATRPDYPILYASAGFFNMTGYTSREVIGRNCRFLQGAETDPADVASIRESLAQGRNYCGRLLNYKKDGTPFWNLLTIAPVKDETGKVLKFIGMQVEVSKFTEGYRDKAVRPNGLPESLIKYDARQKDRATVEVTELIQAVKHPQHPGNSESQDSVPVKGSEGAFVPVVPPGNHSSTATRRGSQMITRSEYSQLGNVPEATSLGDGAARRHRSSGFRSLIGLDRFVKGHASRQEPIEFIEPEILMTRDDIRPDSLDDLDDKERLKEIRRGIDLATTLERIEKNFVITDPRLPDNPIIFASDSFLELTEYTREEVLGRNCRFLQGPETDQETVKKIREAIRDQKDITFQLLNYTKSGKQFWNLFHLQAMRDQKGELQYFIGVQLDGSENLEPIRNRLSERTEKESTKIVQKTAANVDVAVRELPDANLTPDDLWANHSKSVQPKPHKINNDLWKAIQEIRERGEKIGLKHFRPIKPLGFGDTGSVHLVELRGTGELFAMKAMDKSGMLNRNKVHRAHAERDILDIMDHPFLPCLYASFQTKTHLCLVTDFCAGGELFILLDKQPMKVFREDAARFYVAEVVVALEYLHCQGVIYRDLKPENILLQQDGHLLLTDFDLSFLTSCRPELIRPPRPHGKTKKKKIVQPPYFVAEPVTTSNSFVGTEEYIAPEVITGTGHSSAVDWWAVGILLYEMLYGRTPFRGKNRQRTFANVLHKDLAFPSSIPVSLAARQLINGLLHRDPANRLGSHRGANEIKEHVFFHGINWPLIRCMTPPRLEVPFTLTGKDPNADTLGDFEWDDFEASCPFTSDVF